MLKTFEEEKENFGQKGEVLRKINSLLLETDNANVPDTLVITLDYFDKYIKDNLMNGKNKLFSSDVEKQIISEIRQKFKNKKIVVRSSASCEDSVLFTNSGQYDSFLNLSSDKEILTAIKKILYSFLSSNAMEYYKINNIDYKNQGMAVLIQEVAPVVKAGVLFTANPITGLPHPILEYCAGLGENVVSGQKEVVTIKDNYKDLPDVMKRLLVIGKKIENEMNFPQDIEWGIDKNENIYIFQSRPIIINKRNIDDFYKIEPPQNFIKGSEISSGFTIGEISNLTNCDKYKIMLQTGKLTSKDLTTIINSKAILLQTGGYLSHFANIIREFNKPAIILKKTQNIDENEKYVIDGYRGIIYKLNDLSEKDKEKAIWNFMLDLVHNGNPTYLNKLGIKSYKFVPNDKRENLINIKNSELYIESSIKLLIIEFYNQALLNDFINEYLDINRSEKHGRVYRCK